MNETLPSLIYALSGKYKPWSFRCASGTVNCIKQSPSWTADSSSASQQIPLSLCNPKGHYGIHKYTPPVPNPKSQQSSPFSPSHFFKIHFTRNNILPSTPWSSQVYIFRFFPLKPTMHLFCPPSVPHAPPISWFLLWSREHYMVQISDHKAAPYVIFCTPLLPRLSYGQLCNPAPHSSIPFACDPLSVSEISHTPISNNRHNYSSVYLNLYIFGYQTGRHKILHRLIAIIHWLHYALNWI
jgi:hypothetical protein